MRLFLALLLVLVVTACKHVPRRAECAAHEGTAWREVTSAHFRVRTNLAQAEAHEATFELEKMRKALMFAWRGQFDPPGRMDVVILQSNEQLEEFASERIAGFVTRDRDGYLMVMGGESYAFDASPEQLLITHELAHYLSAYVMLRQPRWLAEGMAGYLETTRPYGTGNEYRMGEANLSALYWMKSHSRVSWEDLWKWESQDFDSMRDAERHTYYSTSWLWVHFLINKHPQPFSEFQSRLGRAEEPRAAWNAAFASIPHAELERELRVYLSQGTYSAFRYPVDVPREVRAERALTDGEVHAVRARLFATGAKPLSDEEQKSRFHRELRLALEREPGNFEALSIRASMAEPAAERIRLMRELTEQHPERAEAWAQLANSLFSQPDAAAERRAAAVKAVQLAPDDANALNTLAWDYVQSGQPKVGLTMAMKAARLQPWSPEILDTWAAALAGAGKCADAIAVQKRAMDMLSERASKAARDDYGSRLRKYESECSTASKAP